VLSDLVVLEAPVPYPEGAFTAGLLHDVGKLLIAVAVPTEFERMCVMYKSGAGSAEECELETAGVTHAEISGAILERWKLPKPIQEAARYHHSPDQAAGGEPHLAYVIQAADHYISSKGLSSPPYCSRAPEAFENCYKNTGLGECILKVAETFQAEFEAVRSFF
jgi:HD-like signal output (HDOD) protein